MADFSLSRIVKAAREVYFPFHGVWRVVAQLLAWAAALGFVASQWNDVLPSSREGRLLLAILIAMLLIASVSAAYRLLGRLEDESKKSRAERDELRRRVAVGIQQLFVDGLRVRRAVRKSPDQQAAAAVKAMKGHLEEFRHEVQALTTAEAGDLLRIHSQLEDALELPTDRLRDLPEQIFEPIYRALEYSYELGGGGPELDQEEIAAIQRWKQTQPSRRQ